MGICALVVHLVFATAAVAADSTMRIRIAWGGGTERQWQGVVRLTSGTLSDLQLLGIEADEAGSIWLADGQVFVEQRGARAYDGVDVLATADADAHLIVALAAGSADGKVEQLDIALRDLVAQSQGGPLDPLGNRLLVMRTPGDRLRVQFERGSLVFDAGEVFPLEVSPHRLGVEPGTRLRLKAQLTSAAGGQRVWTQEFDATTSADGEPDNPVPMKVELPDAEGVYDLVISAIPGGRLRGRLPWKKPLAERKVQLVVLDKKPPAPPEDSPAMAKILEIDPVNPHWWERLGTLPSWMPSLHKGPLGSGDTARWDHSKLGPLVQLGSGGRGAEISWEAYPLPINNPGQPHILEIEYPSDVPQTMGISLLEPNAAGAVVPVGLDSGVCVTDEEADSAPQLAKHRVVFWPRTKAPLLLITNRRPGTRAAYGKIRVYGSPATQFSAIRLRRAPNSTSLQRAATDDRRPERLLAGYLNRPYFAQNFSAPESLDEWSHRSLDDWTTFYQGGLRLVEYLNHVGYNGLMLTVAAEGSAIYPSQRLQATPRYDTGVFFATGQDPVRKDVLEMLFRLFDREGLQLIPAIEFATPLADLEAQKRGEGADRAALEWIGADGQPWTNRHPPKQGLAAYYNPLDPRVQRSMRAVFDEVVGRYAAHPAFGGVALQLAGEGFAQLPGDGGYDDQTVARFEQVARTSVPGKGPERFAQRAQFFAGAANRGWLNWRADVLAGFHRQLARDLTTARPNARLYLAGATLFDSPQIQANLRPALPRRARIDDILLRLGIRPELYREDRGVVWLRPQHVAPANTLASQAVDLEVNLAPDVDRLFGGGREAGSLFYHEPQKARLASFDAKSPFGAGNTYTWLISQISPSGDRNRRRFVHSLATLDAQRMFDGGWLLPLGQEDALRDLIAVYRQLPATAFQSISSEGEPVVIRAAVRDRQTFVYLANDSPWSATVTLDVDALPTDCRMEKLGAGRGVGALVRSMAQGGGRLTVNLQPYDLAGVRFSAAGVRLGRPQVSLGDNVQAILQRRIQDLGARAAALASPTPLPTLENPGFETGGSEMGDSADQIPGWSMAAAMGVGATLDRNEKHGGQQSVRLSSSGPRGSLRSQPVEAPQTGRLSVSLWLRVADREHQPSLRLALEGQLDGNEFYRYAAVGGDRGAAPLTNQWAQYIFQVDDLPTDGLSDLRVRFDLMNSGEVWIDDVQLFDLAFSETERVELTKIIALANFKLQAGQFADCARLLEGYWPQFLLANVPLTQNPLPLAQRPRPATTNPSTTLPAKKPGVVDQMKGYVPKFLQF